MAEKSGTQSRTEERVHKKRVVIVGTGGHAIALLGIVRQLSNWEFIGFVDKNKKGLIPVKKGTSILEGCPVLGSRNELEKIQRQEKARHVIIAIGDNQERKQFYQMLVKKGLVIPTLIHPSGYVDPSAVIGRGCVVGMGALIGTKVVLGDNSIVNSGVIIDHESRIGAHAHIAPGCRIAGRVTVGDETFIGIGATVIDKIKIGAQVTVGAGSVVVSDIPDKSVAYGIPAKVMKQREIQ